MKKNKDTSNLIFSAFLVIAFIICAYFCSILIQDSSTFTDTFKFFAMSLMYAVFGLVLFYATRVGDGKQVKRFSLATLIIMVLPALYIIIAGLVPNLPFSEQIASHSQVVSFAAVAFGYGLPYTFLSGYELDTPKEDDNKIADTQPVSEEQISEQEISDAFDELAKTVPDVSGESDSEENKDTKGRILSNRIH